MVLYTCINIIGIIAESNHVHERCDDPGHRQAGTYNYKITDRLQDNHGVDLEGPRLQHDLRR